MWVAMSCCLMAVGMVASTQERDKARQDDAAEARFTRSLGKLAGKISKQVAPSVVALRIDRGKDPEGFNRSGGASPGYYRRPKGLVSGTVIEKDGTILTSYFNVSGEIRKITVILPSGKEHEAKLLGYDKGLDVAVLKIDAKDLPILRTARMDGVRQGNIVFVIGRSPDPARPTITEGIISATHRMKENAVQLDAEINFGSSGGPVVDLEGHMIGIAGKVSPKASWGQSGGVGFAIRIDKIQSVLPRLKKGEKIEKQKNAWIGILLGDSEDPEGVRIQEVLGGSPAEAAELKRDDVIIKLNGNKIRSVIALQQAIRTRAVGEEVTLTILRQKEDDSWREQTIKIKLGENPNE